MILVSDQSVLNIEWWAEQRGELGWVGLCWFVLCRIRLGSVVLDYGGLCCAELGWVRLGCALLAHVGLDRVGLGWAGLCWVEFG